jgi:EmrB/QacA subfamily drug resistance transporter
MSDTAALDQSALPAASPAAGHVPSEVPDPRRWAALASVLTASFMVLLDVSIVAVAIPAIRTNLAASDADIQFVVAGYSLAYAVMLITGGRLGDILGRKRLFMIGMAGFISASALCGLAQSALMLDLSRVLQGLMAALMYPQVLSIIQVSFSPRERGRVFGLLGAIIGLATVAGPLVGGLIIRNDITGGSWRWIFLVNLPIGIVSLAVALRVIGESTAPNATRLDLPGMALATVGLVLLVYPLVEGQTAGWPLWTYVCMGLSPVALALFVLYERSLPVSRFPLVQLSMFRVRAFRVGMVISLVFLAGIPAFFFTFSLMMQVGLGWSALHAGLTTVPWSLAAAFASIMSVRLAPRLGRSIIAIGSALMVAGMLGLVLTLHLAGLGVTSWDLVPTFLVAGLGMGAVVAPLINIILAGIPPRDAGSASGVLTTFQQLGGAMGVAVVGVVFFALLSGRAPTAAAQVSPQLTAQLTRANLPPPAVSSSVANFTRCFEAQAASSNPQQSPPGCAPRPGPAAAAFTTAAQTATAADFVSSIERVLFFMVGFWTLTALLAVLLPRAHPTAAGGAPAGH